MMRVDYDELIRAYHDNLERRLRGFSSGADFLELFVPDEDPLRGIDSLLEAARSAGLERLIVVLGASAAELDRRRLLALAAEHGSATLRELAEGLELELAFDGRAPARTLQPAFTRPSRRQTLPEPEQAAAVGEELALAYREAALSFARTASHEGELDDEQGTIALTAREPPLCLSARVAPADHRILATAHRGATTELSRGMLECACRLIVGLPILEAAEHGALRTELALRQREAERPRTGVVLPEHGGLALSKLAALLNQLLASYRQKTGYAAHDSDYWPPPSAEWLVLSEPARLEAINAVLRARWPRGELSASAVRQLTRVSVSVAPNLTGTERQRALLEAEIELRRKLEPTLVVEREPRPDLSPIRRL